MQASVKNNQVEYLGKGKVVIINSEEGKKKEFCIKKLLFGATNSNMSLHKDIVR